MHEGARSDTHMSEATNNCSVGLQAQLNRKEIISGTGNLATYLGVVKSDLRKESAAASLLDSNSPNLSLCRQLGHPCQRSFSFSNGDYHRITAGPRPWEQAPVDVSASQLRARIPGSLRYLSWKELHKEDWKSPVSMEATVEGEPIATQRTISN